MKKILPLTFTVLISTYASSVSANDSWYLGVLYNTQDISRDFDTAGLIAGYQYNQYLALETRLSTGTSGYSSFYGTPEAPRGEYKEDIDTQVSLLIKASYPLFESFNLYGLVGYTNTQLEISGLGQNNDSNGNVIGDYDFESTHSEHGLSYGIGLNYQLNKQFNIFIDYQILPDYEPTPTYTESSSSTTIGVNYYF
ncbi:porin family protein [Colwellia sp. MB3u-70]|uniref:porin family protein n=1 Tax=unclassified Colwellia TaxID=196834 RepID=UPI0015F3A6C9|nr:MULTISPECIES: porin family protein [unclassified Colwellia]MBA6293788.1 porin family protein [Colwellia sp. MB3u-8]MBA6306736.1 porin family protein [Colwellia sp. MB3u-70]